MPFLCQPKNYYSKALYKWYLFSFMKYFIWGPVSLPEVTQGHISFLIFFHLIHEILHVHQIEELNGLGLYHQCNMPMLIIIFLHQILLLKQVLFNRLKAFSTIVYTLIHIFWGKEKKERKWWALGIRMRVNTTEEKGHYLMCKYNQKPMNTCCVCVYFGRWTYKFRHELTLTLVPNVHDPHISHHTLEYRYADM